MKTTPLVLWQTVQGPPGVVQAEGVNAAIRELVGSRPTAAIADWAGLVGEEELSYDGVHPDLGHEDAMARVVAPMLTRWWNATTADEARLQLSPSFSRSTGRTGTRRARSGGPPCR